MTLKAKILEYVRAQYPNFVHKGEIGRKAVLEFGYENENAGRRCRELEQEGVFEKIYNEKHEVMYRAKPIDGLIDGCQMDGKCRWKSRFDRGCPDCVARGWKPEHVHLFNRDTTLGKNTQCDCGEMDKKLLSSPVESKQEQLF